MFVSHRCFCGVGGGFFTIIKIDSHKYSNLSHHGLDKHVNVRNIVCVSL